MGDINKNKEYGLGTVVVILKDGKEYVGSLFKFKPEKNFFSIKTNATSKAFSFDDVESVIEYGARISVNSPPEGEEHDLLEEARKQLRQGREYGWFKDPIKKWEEK